MSDQRIIQHHIFPADQYIASKHIRAQRAASSSEAAMLPHAPAGLASGEPAELGAPAQQVDTCTHKALGCTDVVSAVLL